MGYENGLHPDHPEKPAASRDEAFEKWHAGYCANDSERCKHKPNERAAYNAGVEAERAAFSLERDKFDIHKKNVNGALALAQDYLAEKDEKIAELRAECERLKKRLAESEEFAREEHRVGAAAEAERDRLASLLGSVIEKARSLSFSSNRADHTAGVVWIASLEHPKEAAAEKALEGK